GHVAAFIAIKLNQIPRLGVMDSPSECHPDESAREEHSVSEYPADTDEDNSVLAKEYCFTAGLLTQPCDGSVESEVSCSAQYIVGQDSPGLNCPNDRPANNDDIRDAKGGYTSGHSPSAENASKFTPGDEHYDYEPYLVAQSKKLFSASFEENIDSNSSGNSIDDDDENSDNSSVGENEVSTPIQERRARNILRHSEFARSLNLGKLDGTSGLAPEMVEKRQQEKQKLNISSLTVDEGDHDEFTQILKKRGMTFSTHLLRKKTKKYPGLSQPHPGSMLTNSISYELEAKYPGRSLQIKILSSHLESIVRETILAWKSKCPSHNNHYSEASYNGEIKLSSPAPVIVSGPGGTGKTSVVYDAQLHDCYHPKASCVRNHKNLASNDGCDTRTIVHLEQADHNIFTANLMDSTSDYMMEIHESDDEGLGVEDFIERQRKSFRVKHFRKGRKNEFTFDRQPPERSSKFYREARQNSATASCNAGPTGTHRVSQHSFDSTPIALFGRAVSMLLQGGLSHKRRPKYGRCAFFVLDNADRMLAWRKSGSRNALAQLFKLPSVMGINLTLIFISRGALLTYSGLRSHKSPGMITDAVHPISIYFDSYTSVDKMKKQMVTGESFAFLDREICPLFKTIIAEVNDIVYKSMISSFLLSVKSSLFDVSEVLRLSRMLWSEFIRPFGNEESQKEYQTLVWKMIHCLRHTNNNTNSNLRCASEGCSFCNRVTDAYCFGDEVMNLHDIKNKLFEMLDHNIRETVRCLLADVLVMPGRVIEHTSVKSYAERLPYNTKFLLLAAFICQQKTPDRDANLFTTTNNGKRSNRGSKLSGEGTAYSFSSSDLKQLWLAKPQCFSLERLISVFTVIMHHYGQTTRAENEVAELGTDELFRNISSLIAGGLLYRIHRSTVTRVVDKTDFMLEKLTCPISSEDAQIIASSVGFPLGQFVQA
ncbi:hypothetical protein ACHAWX_003189, partial [Stephanocyclus meneghinianus]